MRQTTTVIKQRQHEAPEKNMKRTAAPIELDFTEVEVESTIIEANENNR